HLLFSLIEWLRGKPVSLRKREIAQQVGMVLLVGLMIFAFYNDIFRWLARP
ncbi:MAG: RIP metalloprotease RseP, partial [candidate division NC10 bacterium]|nr:RIP metalloprotease RseP [candidate division NC10 bacterium]